MIHVFRTIERESASPAAFLCRPFMEICTQIGTFNIRFPSNGDPGFSVCARLRLKPAHPIGRGDPAT